MQPFGDRSKVVIEPMLTDQWFVDTAQIVGPALDAVRSGETKIMPEQDRKVYFNWLENIEPWCISRQLWWGHQIPVWYGPIQSKSGALTVEYTDGGPQYVKTFCANSEKEAILLAQDYYGDKTTVYVSKQDELFHELQAKGEMDSPTEPAYQIHLHEEGKPSVAIHRDPDVLDTWFSSGLWPIGTLGWPEDTDAMRKYFPTSTLVTGQDILFFWVARMMMMQLAVLPDSLPIKDRIPFDTVYLHGLVRDAKGKKMSKSTGNVMDPLDIIDEYGADALRFSSAAMAALGGVLKLDMERIKGYRNFGTKLWNAARFAELNNAYQDRSQAVYTWCTGGAQGVPPKSAVNLWIIGELAKTRETVDAALDAYRFNDAANALYAFVWGTFCDWYVELSKPLLQGDDAEKANETKAVLSWTLDQCLILLHPIMPFITEELWGKLATRDTMLIHADWPTFQAVDLVDDSADTEMNWVVSLIEGIRSARAQMHVPAGAYIACVVKDLTSGGQAAYDANKTMIDRLARIDGLTHVDEFPKGTVTLGVPGGSFGLPLADVIDIAEEKARLEKSLGKLAKEIGGLRGRLNNPKFRDSAPEDVVAETETNLAAREEEEAKLKEALDRLSELG
jgi:valyl-tRNA synthetase